MDAFAEGCRPPPGALVMTWDALPFARGDAYRLGARNRWGKTCSRKRRMNASGVSEQVLSPRVRKTMVSSAIETSREEEMPTRCV